MKYSNNCITLTRNIFSSLVLCLSLSAPAVAEILLADDFPGTSLAPNWIIQRGYADVSDGYVDTYGSTVGRDSAIETAVGNTDWTDYHLSTHFIADGGGNNWYNAIVNFRVQEHNIGSWTEGNYYNLILKTPLWGSHEGAAWEFFRNDNDGGFSGLLANDLAPVIRTS